MLVRPPILFFQPHLKILPLSFIFKEIISNSDVFDTASSADGTDKDSRQSSPPKIRKTVPTIGGVTSFKDMTCQNIKELLDVHIDAMSKPWKGSIKFKCFVFENLKTDIPHLLSGQPKEIDICDYLCGQFPSAKRLYFDIEKYPPPNGKT